MVPAAYTASKEHEVVKTPLKSMCTMMKEAVGDADIHQPFTLWRQAQGGIGWEYIQIAFSREDREDWKTKVGECVWKDGDQVIFLNGDVSRLPSSFNGLLLNPNPLATNPTVAALRDTALRDRTPAVIIRYNTDTPEVKTKPAQMLDVTEVEKKAIVKAVEKVKACLGTDWRQWALAPEPDSDQPAVLILEGINIQRPFPVGNLLKVVHVYLTWLQEVESESGKIYPLTVANQDLLWEKFLSGASLSYTKKALKPLRNLVSGDANKQSALLVLGINPPPWADTRLKDSSDYHNQAVKFILERMKWHSVANQALANSEGP